MLNITFALQAFQPSGDFGAVETHFTASGSGQDFREDLRQCLPLKIHVRLRVAHCGVDIRMTEPLADSRKIDSGFQNANNGGIFWSVVQQSGPTRS